MVRKSPKGVKCHSVRLILQRGAEHRAKVAREFRQKSDCSFICLLAVLFSWSKLTNPLPETYCTAVNATFAHFNLKLATSLKLKEAR